jgi:SAM-dependent methyltransferase
MADAPERRDPDNPTYVHDTSTLYGEGGEVSAYQRQKFVPVLDAIEAESAPRAPASLALLDVGVGYGAFLRLCEERGYGRLAGMDPFPESIRIAGRHTDASLHEGDAAAAEWPFEAGSFDVISCLDVVEHLEEPRVFWDNARRYLGPDGLLVVRTPNGQLPYRLRRVPLLGIPDPNPTHINVHPPDFWRALAAEAGWRIVREWRGEHLTHLRLLPRALNVGLRRLGIDPRRVPGVAALSQAYVMLMRADGAAG